MYFASYLYGATLLIAVLEIAAGRHKGIYRRDDWLVAIACSLSTAVARPLAAVLVASCAFFLMPRYRNALAGASVWWSFPCVLLVAEFCFYWVHRLAHEAKGGRHDWLWKLHRTHHSGKFMNVGVMLRVNMFWNFIVPTPWVAGIAAYLGLGPAAALTVVTIYGWNIITHSNFRWDDPLRRHAVAGAMFRRFERILVSPGIHHTHHGYGKDGGNYRNYAVTFSFLDGVFGTMHVPSGRPWRYGVPGPNAHWVEEALFPLIGADSQGHLRILPGLPRRAPHNNELRCP